jgi:hypothetical protein
MSRTPWFLLCLLLVAAACGQAEDDCVECPPADDDDTADDDDQSPDDDTADEIPTLSDPIRVVPSAGLPDEVTTQPANNNLDVTFHDGRVFLAFRTAQTHFAGRTVRLFVVSSADQVNWDFETTFFMETDLREPRLLSWNGRLFLYFAVLGTNPLDFEPQGMMVSEYQGPGEWTPAEWFYDEGFIPWRAKVIDDVPYLLAYVGGGSIYDLNPEPIDVHWLTTTDGVNWAPVIPGQPVVLSGGTSETDFVFLDDGSLVAVSRDEAGGPEGFGMRICRAPADDLGQWECVVDPRKYDSPLVFRHGPDVYLIGRRNVTGDGYYDLGYDDLPLPVQHILYELDYWIHPKRCSLWKIDPDELRVDFVLDLPSRGDTCFPGLLTWSADEFTVYNYTSPLDGPDEFWLQGQLGPTKIVRVDLAFPAH